MIRISRCAMLAILVLPLHVQAQEPPVDSALRQASIHTAEQFLNAFIEDRVEDAVALYDSVLAVRSSSQRLRGIRMSIFGSMGTFERQGEARIAGLEGDVLTVVIPMVFDRSELGANIKVNRSGRITGFSFLPGGEVAGWQPPTYAEPSRFQEQEVQIHTPGEDPLEGLLTIPSGVGPFPGVVLLHGAGPGNKDAGMGATLPFRDLAWGLASNGIAVLRYDKRSFAHPYRFEGQVYTPEEDVIADARAALDLLCTTGKVDPDQIYLLGHSMGGMMAPRIVEAGAEVAGLILMAVPSRPLSETIRSQVEYLANLPGAGMPPAQLESTRTALDAIDQLTADDARDPKPVLGLPAAYWLDLRSYDQVVSARRLSIHMLFLQGGRDFQVTAEDFSGWRKALTGYGPVTFRPYPSLNHLFITGEGPSSFDEYQKPGHVSEEVVMDIAAWVRIASVKRTLVPD